MKLRLYRENGALNSKPVFDAFEAGMIKNGDITVPTYEEADAVVIWSVLFKGRMAANKAIWDRAQAEGKPVIVLEVGTLKRNKSWRVGINGINRDASWADFFDVTSSRAECLGLELKPWQDNSKEFITIATQRPDSLQWANMPSVETWLHNTITKVQSVSKRPIVIRPHPRDSITRFDEVWRSHQDVFFDIPQKVGNYDEVNFGDILTRTHVLINYCTSPAVEAVLNGVPVVVGEPSMAWDVRTEIENIETPNNPDREIWLDKLCHTEWYEEEIESGVPWERLRRLV